MRHKKIATWIAVLAGCGIAVAILWPRLRNWRPQGTVIQGAVIRKDADTHKQLPIAGVQITATHGTVARSTQSDASGYFKIRFPGTIWPGQTLSISFHDDGFRPLELQMPVRFRSATTQLIVAALTPTAAASQTESHDHATTVVSNILVRYTVNSEVAQNIGSAVRTFQVQNRGNVPCMHQKPCSPDRRWKASIGSIELQAGSGNEFRDVRVSCIAGPCPFTRIDANSRTSGRTVTVTAQDWSDTATFLLEAEVFRTSIVAEVRESYPAIFGRTLSFALPPTAEGVSLEGDLGGTPMVFPLGPDLYLSWASCSLRVDQTSDRPSVYQCELKPGYRF